MTDVHIVREDGKELDILPFPERPRTGDVIWNRAGGSGDKFIVLESGWNVHAGRPEPQNTWAYVLVQELREWTQQRQELLSAHNEHPRTRHCSSCSKVEVAP